jgi:hypothetical protein
MAEITIPTILASSATFGLLRADVETELLTGASVFTEFTKAAWTYQAQLTVQTEAQGRAWAVALTQLSRFSNYFKAGPPGYAGGTYTATTLQVDGAGQLGTSLDIKNGNTLTKVITAGEYFEVNGELKLAVTDCVTNSTGKGSVSFEPPLRVAPLNSANINLSSPKAKFRLLSPQAQWRIEPGQFYILSLDAVEAL